MKIVRPGGPWRRLRLRIERIRLARSICELSGLIDVQHDVAEAARERIARLARRDRALERLIGG
jgi:hypothetical protein